MNSQKSKPHLVANETILDVWAGLHKMSIIGRSWTGTLTALVDFFACV